MYAGGASKVQGKKLGVFYFLKYFYIFKIFFVVVFIFHSASRTPLEISPENFLVSYWANNL